jgi:predicted nucleotide-binding protein
MLYYHARIKYTQVGTGTPLRFFVQDLSEIDVRKITEPFNDGVSFQVEDKFFEGDYVDNIAVFKTDRKFKDLINEVRKFDPKATYDDIWTYIMEGLIGDDVSSTFIKKSKIKKQIQANIEELSKNVFIVHGRDHKTLEELKSMIKSFGLNPIVLHEQPSGSKTIVEKLEKYSNVGYVFVILTPDDIGSINESSLNGALQKVKEVCAIVDKVTLLNATLQDFLETYTAIKRKESLKKAYDELSRVINSLEYRARQNVVLEFGYFMGLLGRDKVCCLYKGDVKLPSDMHGIVYIQFKKSVNEVRDKIVRELKAAGYKLKHTEKYKLTAKL